MEKIYLPTQSLRRFGILAVLFVSASCSTLPLRTDAEHVRVYYNEDKINNCEFVGDIVGSAGNMFDYLFIPNKKMVKGALHDLKNIAADMKANTIYVHDEYSFGASMVFSGQAYSC